MAKCNQLTLLPFKGLSQSDQSAQTRELHGDGDDGATAVTAVLPRLWVKFYHRHRGNCGDGDSIHGSAAGAVTALTVRPR